MSWPGVRIVVDRSVPSTRICSGSSTASRSARVSTSTVAPRAPPLSPLTRTFVTLALSINRPMIKEAYYFSADGIGGMSSARRPVGSR